MSWADLQAELNSSDAKNSAPVVPRLDMQRLEELASIADESSMPPPGAEVMMEQSQKITTALTLFVTAGRRRPLHRRRRTRIAARWTSTKARLCSRPLTTNCRRCRQRAATWVFVAANSVALTAASNSIRSTPHSMGATAMAKNTNPARQGPRLRRLAPPPSPCGGCPRDTAVRGRHGDKIRLPWPPALVPAQEKVFTLRKVPHRVVRPPRRAKQGTFVRSTGAHLF